MEETQTRHFLRNTINVHAVCRRDNFTSNFFSFESMEFLHFFIGLCLLLGRIVDLTFVLRYTQSDKGHALQTDHSEPVSFGDLSSVGDCHPECDGGCSESRSAVACFRCKHFTQTLRNKAGNGFKCVFWQSFDLKVVPETRMLLSRCVAHCDDTYYLDGSNCKMCSPHCHSCTQAEVRTTNSGKENSK